MVNQIYYSGNEVHDVSFDSTDDELFIVLKLVISLQVSKYMRKVFSLQQIISSQSGQLQIFDLPVFAGTPKKSKFPQSETFETFSIGV